MGLCHDARSRGRQSHLRFSRNQQQEGFPPTFSRLEKSKGKELPDQTQGLYPSGCKHVPAKSRRKLDEHATSCVPWFPSKLPGVSARILVPSGTIYLCRSHVC